MNKHDLDRFRAETGLGLLDSKKALEVHGTLKNALSFFSDAKKTISDVSRKLAQARKSDRSWGWWRRDFLSRSASELLLYGDPILDKWGHARREFDALVNNLTRPKIKSYDDLAQKRGEYRGWAGDEENVLGHALWLGAMATHVAPRFEAAWLGALKEDPFQELRPLQRSEISELVLKRNAVFENPASPDRGKYVAEALFQAEQYHLAARAVDLATKPLLLYYMAASLVRACLVLRIEHFIGRYGSHGLKIEYAGPGLIGKCVRPTKSGLFQALVEGLPGAPIVPDVGPWTLLDLCALVPELSDVLNRYFPTRSSCQRILRYTEHHRSGIGLPWNYHLSLVLPESFLTHCGVKIGADQDAFKKNVRESFPGSFWKLGRDHELCDTISPELDERIVAYAHCARSREEQRRLYPMIHQGGLDGEWYVVYNHRGSAPHQFTVLYAIFYALSMLVRYRPVEWSEMLAGGDGAKAIVDRLCRVALQKLPMLATEVLLSKRVLGSLDTMPN